MTAAGLINILNSLPYNTKIISNSGWEDETDIESVWYNPSLKIAVLTQCTSCRNQNIYGANGYKLIYNSED